MRDLGFSFFGLQVIVFFILQVFLSYFFFCIGVCFFGEVFLKLKVKRSKGEWMFLVAYVGIEGVSFWVVQIMLVLLVWELFFRQRCLVGYKRYEDLFFFMLEKTLGVEQKYFLFLIFWLFFEVVVFIRVWVGILDYRVFKIFFKLRIEYRESSG